ncbi:MAG TPA: PH domain-containing protein [Actinotalea sp.]
MSRPGSGAEQRADLNRPFRPRAARVVGTALALAVGVMVGLLVTLLPAAVTDRSTTGDRVGIAVFGVGVAWFLLRHAAVRAVPDEVGLTVTNLLLTRRITWAEIVSVRFGEGRPWVQLDLDDGGTLAVMAVQRADGAYARAEARRLATLVSLHSATAADD